MSKTSPSVPADFWSRLLAQLVENAIWMLPLALGAWYISMQGTLVDVGVALANVFLMVIIPMGFIYVLYAILMISHFGGTLGKLALGLEITDEEGNSITWKRAFFREMIAKAVSGFILGVGYLAVLWSPKKLAWHDTLSGTVVHQRGTRYGEGIALLIGIMCLIGWLVYQTINGFAHNTQLIGDIKQLFSVGY
jgi:uncharacterized RDD family membrane protein YckC